MQTNSIQRLRTIRLQTRLIIYSTLLILGLMTLIIFFVEKRQCETIRDEAQKRGRAIARNLAAVSTNALLTYNYILLKQNAEKVVLEPDIVYVIIHDKETLVAAHSGHDEKQGVRLLDGVSERAVRAKEPLVQQTYHEEEKARALDIAIPVYIKQSDEKWGTIRIGLSLERMYGQIFRTRINLLFLGLFAIVLGILGSIFFARRITRPISRLVETTVSAAAGDLEQKLEIRTGDEIEELGKNFDHMIHQIRLQRDELEKHLREITLLKTYSDNILSSMTNGLVTIDLEQRVVTLNKMAEIILKKKRDEVVGLPLDRALSLYPAFCRMMSETLVYDKPIFFSELKLEQEQDGLWLTASTSLLTNGDGEKIGTLAIFQDITQMKILEEKLRQADRLAALGTLSAGLAHEIKNPLSAIKTFAQLLPQKGENHSFMEKFHVTVPREIDRINCLVEDLLELTRTRKRPMVSLDVKQLIAQVIDLHGEEMNKKDIRFEDRREPTIPFIQGDPETLHRVLSNLVINAIQAMPNGGVLSISSARENVASPRVKITIQDTGIGMDETTVNNLFNPFFTTKDKGVGLGMALVHKIVEDHCGRIEVNSVKGTGTSFVLWFPVEKV
jgi:PAS domain S-box-containing protein